ncbi:hypothetical protein FPRO03_13853 [Fusarium proliferatum]|nr:hypothetical protein FPRO03_13853 [Fusarium proliferatum]
MLSIIYTSMESDSLPDERAHVTDSQALLALADDSQIQPGSWNLRTYDLILGDSSDVIGQFVLAYAVRNRSEHCAMIINTASILAAAIVTLSSGAIEVLTQPLGSFFASRLSRHSHILPGVLSGFSCIIAYSVIIFLKKTDADAEKPSQDESRPLLADQQQTSCVDDAPASQMAVPGYVSRPGRSNSPLREQDLRFLPIVFGLMGFCKSTRPLFTTFIQHRHGVSPIDAEYLWLVRTVLSAVLFVLTGLYTAYIKESDSFNHVQARIAILFISAGALAIGLPGSYNKIPIALIINTFGVVTDLSILASVSTLLGRLDAGPVLMLIASTESLGKLVGTGALYPLYQLSLRDSLHFLAGGIPYYICGSLYAVAAFILWSVGPKPVTE